MEQCAKSLRKYFGNSPEQNPSESLLIDSCHFIYWRVQRYRLHLKAPYLTLFTQSLQLKRFNQRYLCCHLLNLFENAFGLTWLIHGFTPEQRKGLEWLIFRMTLPLLTHAGQP